MCAYGLLKQLTHILVKFYTFVLYSVDTYYIYESFRIPHGESQFIIPNRIAVPLNNLGLRFLH